MKKLMFYILGIYPEEKQKPTIWIEKEKNKTIPYIRLMGDVKRVSL
jgi:hypothetical protein